MTNPPCYKNHLISTEGRHLGSYQNCLAQGCIYCGVRGFNPPDEPPTPQKTNPTPQKFPFLPREGTVLVFKIFCLWQAFNILSLLQKCILLLIKCFIFSKCSNSNVLPEAGFYPILITKMSYFIKNV